MLIRNSIDHYINDDFFFNKEFFLLSPVTRNPYSGLLYLPGKNAGHSVQL